jgi:hypothetical protein
MYPLLYQPDQWPEPTSEDVVIQERNISKDTTNNQKEVVIPIDRPVTEYYPKIGVTLPKGTDPIRPGLIPRPPSGNIQTPNVPFPQLKHMAIQYLETNYLGGAKSSAVSILKFLDDNYPDITEDVKQTVAQGAALTEEVNNFLASTEYDEKTIKRLTSAFPLVKDIVSLDLPIVPDIVRETILGAMEGTIWTLVTGEEPPPYVINSAVAMESEFMEQTKRSPNTPYRSQPKDDRAEWFARETSGLRTRWSKSLKDAQATALEMLALPLALPFTRSLVDHIVEFLKFQSIKGAISRAGEKANEDVPVQETKGDTFITNTTTNVYEDTKTVSDDEEPIFPIQPEEPSIPPVYPLAAPIYTWATEGPRYTGGGGTVHRKEKSIPSYCMPIVQEALNTGDYSIVPPECRVLLNEKVGTDGIQRSVGTYPILSTGKQPSKVFKRRGNR